MCIESPEYMAKTDIIAFGTASAMFGGGGQVVSVADVIVVAVPPPTPAVELGEGSPAADIGELVPEGIVCIMSDGGAMGTTVHGLFVA